MSRAYWSNVVQVSGGVVLGQLVGIVGFMLLTWVYRPEAFGTYASWLAIVSIGSVMCTGAIETSLIRDSDGDQRMAATAKVVWTGLVGAVILALASGLALALVPSFLPGSRVLAGAAIGAGAFVLAANLVLQAWAAAEGRFKALTLMRIAQSSLIMFCPLALGAFGQTSHHLIWGHVAGLAVAMLAWLKVFPSTAFRGIKPADLLSFWSERSRCFKFVLPALLVGAVAGNLPQLAIGWRFGVEAGGHLALTQRVLGVPLSLVGMAVRDVFRRHASVAYRHKGECSAEFRNSFLVLSAVAVAFTVVMLPFSERLFVLVFGEPWRLAGVMARWLLVMYAVGIVASPLTYLVYIVEREDFDLYWQSALLVVIAMSLFAFGDIETTLIVFAFAYAAMYVVYVLFCARFARGDFVRAVASKTLSNPISKVE